MNKRFIPYNEVKNCIKILDEKITLSKWKPDLILSINRGGCIPGIYLSHLRGINHEVLSFKNKINSYIPFYLKKIENIYSNILIIDDINDTGKTLIEIKKKYNQSTFKFKFAVLISNRSSSFKVDYYSNEIDKKVYNSWIVFPWENIDA